MVIGKTSEVSCENRAFGEPAGFLPSTGHPGKIVCWAPFTSHSLQVLLSGPKTWMFGFSEQKDGLNTKFLYLYNLFVGASLLQPTSGRPAGLLSPR